MTDGKEKVPMGGPMQTVCPTSKNLKHLNLVSLWLLTITVCLFFLCELKIYHLSFFIITQGAFHIADPSSMPDACHNELSKYDLARHESPSSSVVRASDRCMGGHGFDSRRGLRFFLCPTIVSN